MGEFHKNIISLYGDAGKKWIDELPEIVRSYAKKWQLHDLRVTNNLTYNYVVFIAHNAVLKIGFNQKDIQQEIKALMHFQNIKLLRYDEHAILMERCIPGTTLTSFVPHKDQQATDICISLMQNFYKPSNTFTQHLSDWLTIIYKDHNLNKDYLKKAQKFTDHLLNSSSETVVLHGDLHHGNILKHNERYVAIDPKGILGERAYDIACFIRNPLEKIIKNFDLIPKRIEQFSQACAIDPVRLKQWCFLHGILSACWRIEDHQNPKSILKFCDFIYSIL